MTCTECGRKQRTLFQFPESDSVKINKLMLPIPRGLEVTAQDKGTLITWHEVIPPQQPIQSTLIGYNVYRFVKGRFVSKSPITKRPVAANQFLDARCKKNRNNYSYMVRAVFSIDKQIIQGPASHITGISDTE